MALTALPRFAVALVLATAALLQGQLGIVGAQDACSEYDSACSQDSVCSDCKETAGTNVVAFETCVANYVYASSVCINQSMQPCCQAEASETDCLANENYTNYYDCRLLTDVGDDCTSLVCDAVGTATPTSAGTAEVAEDADTAADDSGAPRASTLVVGRENGAAAAALVLVVATAVSFTSLAAAAFD